VTFSLQRWIFSGLAAIISWQAIFSFHQALSWVAKEPNCLSIISSVFA
jgi:hypothetical protein